MRTHVRICGGWRRLVLAVPGFVLLQQAADWALLRGRVGLPVARELLSEIPLGPFVAFAGVWVGEQKISEREVATPLRSTVIYDVEVDHTVSRAVVQDEYETALVSGVATELVRRTVP